jgi:hypothetical protein
VFCRRYAQGFCHLLYVYAAVAQGTVQVADGFGFESGVLEADGGILRLSPVF